LLPLPAMGAGGSWVLPTQQQLSQRERGEGLAPLGERRRLAEEAKAGPD